MRNCFLIATALISLCGIGPSALADDALGTAGLTALLSPAPQDFVTIRTAYVTPPTQLNRLLELPLELEDRRMLSSAANASLFGGRLKSDGELRFGPTPSGSFEQRGGVDRRLMRLGMTGIQGPFHYGVSVREAGKAVMDGPDLGSREMWGEWHFGAARLRTSLSDFWNNVERDPTRSRITQTQERIGLTVPQAAWPEVTLAFSRTALASSLDPQGIAAQRRAVTAYEGSLAYGGPGWNARATASYAANADIVTPGMDTRALSYGVNGTYQVKNVFSLSPSLNLRDEQQRWSGVSLLTRSGSLTLAYTPDPHLSVKALAVYNQTTSTDNLLALSDFNTTSTVTWKPDSLARFHASLSLETSHKVTHNNTIGVAQLEDTSGVIRLQFADLVIW